MGWKLRKEMIRVMKLKEGVVVNQWQELDSYGNIKRDVSNEEAEKLLGSYRSKWTARGCFYLEVSGKEMEADLREVHLSKRKLFKYLFNGGLPKEIVIKRIDTKEAS